MLTKRTNEEVGKVSWNKQKEEREREGTKINNFEGARFCPYLNAFVSLFLVVGKLMLKKLFLNYYFKHSFFILFFFWKSLFSKLGDSSIRWYLFLEIVFIIRIYRTFYPVLLIFEELIKFINKTLDVVFFKI